MRLNALNCLIYCCVLELDFVARGSAFGFYLLIGRSGLGLGLGTSGLGLGLGRSGLGLGLAKKILLT